MKDYRAGIRALGEENYLELAECYESEFTFWIKRAAEHSKRLGGKRCFVDFFQRPHTFEVQSDGSSHLMNPSNNSIVDPALSAQTEGD